MVSFLSEAVADGIARGLSPTTMLYCTFGVCLGMLVGVLPGVGIMATIALLMPLTYHLDPLTGISMLAGIYYGAVYGGSTASILLNLPGTASTAITCLDGYPMAKQGRAGVALFMTAIASFVGSILGIALLASFSFPLANLALKFASQEYFALMVLGLVTSAMISSSTPLKSLTMVVLGLLIGLVGVDLNSGVMRYTFGIVHFFDGLSLVAISLGLFGLTELMRNAGMSYSGTLSPKDITFRSMIPTRDDWRRSIPAMLRGSGVGAFFGALPGTGGMVASFVAYAVERRVNKDPERFGKGAIEGISGPEGANNAAVQTAFIPTLTLGIPGDPIMAMMLGVFLIHGIVPGPGIMVNDPGMFWGLIVTFLMGNLILIILNIPLIGLWIRILAIPYSILFPAIVGFLCIGIYSVNYSVVDLYVLLAFGLMGYALIYFEFPIAPMLLGLILGPLMEENFRRAMLLQSGNPIGFFQRPISVTFLAISAMLIAYMVFAEFRKRSRIKSQAAVLSAEN